MKKITKVLALTASLFALIFTGCSSFFENATITGEDLEGQRNLTVYATSKDDVITFGSEDSSRTIAPAAIDGTNSSLVYVLSGKNLITNTDLTAKKVTFVATSGSTTEGIVTISLDVANYELHLKVYDESTNSVEDDTTLLLEATSYADLRYNESVRFFLMPTGTQNTSVSLKLYTDGWDIDDYTGYTAKAYVTKSLTDDTPQTGFSETVALSTATSSSTAVAFPATAGRLKPGTYNFVVEFNNATTNKTFYWSDRLVVLSNQKIDATVGIPLIIGKLPAAPTALTVNYALPTTDDAYYYTSEFNWTDNANNEQCFQLELLDISAVKDTGKIPNASTNGFNPDDTYIMAINAITTKADNAAKAWAALTQADSNASGAVLYKFNNTVYSVYDTDQAGGITYHVDATNPGSLSKNNDMVGLNLPLGKRYLARMCAVNDAGTSTYVYADIFTAGAKTYSTNEWPTNAAAINVFKIAYNLTGGKFYEATYSGSKTVTPTSTDKTSAIESENYSAKLGHYKINTALNTILQYDCQYYNASATSPATPTSTGAAIINGLHSCYDYTSGSELYAALYNGSNKWTSWKVDSTTNAAVMRQTDEWSKVLAPYTAGSSLNESASPADTSADGFSNLNLYAAYTTATAKIYNPADYTVTAKDVVLKLADKSDLASATLQDFTNGSTIEIQPYTYTKLTSATAPSDWATATNKYYNYSTHAVVDGSTTTYAADIYATKDASANKNEYLFVFVKNESKYSKVQIQLKETNGTIVGTYKSSGVIKSNATNPIKFIEKITTKPSDWSTKYNTDYYSDEACTTLCSSDSWTEGTTVVYAKVAHDVESFCIPTTSVKTTSFQATIQAYAGITTDTPYTYPVIFTIQE